MTPTKLDELSLRTPGFQSGVPVVLGDGQVWHFPRPSLLLTPVVRDDGTLAFDSFRYSYEAKCDELVDRLMAADNFLDEANAALALAVAALQRNYALEPAAIATLLPYRMDDETSKAMWASIYDVILGRSPKPTASGSASSAGSPEPAA